MSDRGSVSSGGGGGGDMDLLILLPDGRALRHTVSHNCAVMDLLIQIASKENLKPSAYVIEPLDAGLDDGVPRVLQYKPNTPIGMLNTQVIRLALKNPSKTPSSGGQEHKISHSESFSHRVSNFNRMSGVSAVHICNDPDGFAKLSEDTKKIKSRSNFITSTLPPQVTGDWSESAINSFRLQIHLPRDQLHVIRAQPGYAVDDVLDIMREERGLKLDRYIVVKTNEPDLVIDTRRTLKEYGITELTLKLRPEFDVVRTVNPKKVKKENSSHFKSAFKSFFQQLKPASRSNSVTELRPSVDRARPVVTELRASVPGLRPTSEMPVISQAEFVKPKPPPRKRTHAPPPPVETTVVVAAPATRSHTVSESSCESACEGSVGGSAPATLPRRCRLGVESVSTTNLAIEPPLPTLRRGVSDLAVNKPKYPRRKRLAPKPPIHISTQEIKEDGFEEQTQIQKIDSSLHDEDGTLKITEVPQMCDTSSTVKIDNNDETLKTHNSSENLVKGTSAIPAENYDVAVKPKPIVFEQESASGHTLVAVNIDINDENVIASNQEIDQNDEQSSQQKVFSENTTELFDEEYFDASTNCGINNEVVEGNNIHHVEENTMKDIQLHENNITPPQTHVDTEEAIKFTSPHKEIKEDVCSIIIEQTSYKKVNTAPIESILEPLEKMYDKTENESLNKCEIHLKSTDEETISRDEDINTTEEKKIELLLENRAHLAKEAISSPAQIASVPASNDHVESFSNVVKPESNVLPTITRNVHSDNNWQTSTLPSSKLKNSQSSKSLPQRSISSGSVVSSKPTVDQLLLQIKKMKEKSNNNTQYVKKSHRKNFDQPEIVGHIEKLPPLPVYNNNKNDTCVTPPVSPVTEVISTWNGNAENKSQLITAAAEKLCSVEKIERTNRIRQLPTFMLTSWAEEKRAPVVNRIADYGNRSAIPQKLHTDHNAEEREKEKTFVEWPLPYSLSSTLPRPFVKPSESTVTTVTHKLPTIVNVLEKSEVKKNNEPKAVANGRQSVYSKLNFYNSAPSAVTESYRENGTSIQKTSWELVQDANKQLQENNHSNKTNSIVNNNNMYTNGKSTENTFDICLRGQTFNGKESKNGEGQNGDVKNGHETRNVYAYRKPLQFQLGTWNDKAKSIKIEEHVKLNKNDPPLVQKIDEGINIGERWGFCYNFGYSHNRLYVSRVLGSVSNSSILQFGAQLTD